MQRFLTPQDKPLNLPFCSAVRVGDLLFLSGAIGNAPGTLKLVEGGTAAEAAQAMDNIGATLKHCGLGFDDVVKFTIMLADMSEWAAFNQVYVALFHARKLAGPQRFRLQRPRARRAARDRVHRAVCVRFALATSHAPSAVMPGLVPGIHAAPSLPAIRQKRGSPRRGWPGQARP